MFYHEFEEGPLPDLISVDDGKESDRPRFNSQDSTYFCLLQRPRELRSLSDCLVSAATSGNPTMMRRCLPAAKRQGLSYELSQSRTPVLVIAARYGFTDILQLLIAKGADIEQKDRNSGSTALQHAAMHCHVDTVQHLLASKADVNATNNWGFTALMLAARYGHVEVLKLLLRAGADVLIRDKDGLSAQDWAADDRIRKLLALKTSKSSLESVTSPSTEIKRKPCASEAERIERLFARTFPACAEKPLRLEYLQRRTRSAHYFTALVDPIHLDSSDSNSTAPTPCWMRRALHHIKQWHTADPRLVEDDYATLAARYTQLVADMDAQCRELVKARDYNALQTLAAKLKELKTLDVTPYL